MWRNTLGVSDESSVNVAPTGLRNCGLTEQGKKQCISLRNDLVEQRGSLNFDAVVVSPLRRAQETATEVRLVSVKYPVTTSHLCREYAVEECDFLEDEEIVIEATEHLIERLQNFKAWIKQHYLDCEEIAVVCHGDFIHALLSPTNCCDQDDESPYWLENACYVVIDW